MKKGHLIRLFFALLIFPWRFGLFHCYFSYYEMSYAQFTKQSRKTGARVFTLDLKEI